MFYAMKNLYLYDLSILLIIILLLVLPAFLLRKQPVKLIILLVTYGTSLFIAQVLDLQVVHVSALHPDSQNLFEEQTHRMYALHRAGDTNAALNEAHRRLELLEREIPELDLRHIEAVHDVGWLSWQLQHLDVAKDYLQRSLALYKQKEKHEWYIPNYLRQVPEGVHGIGNEHYILAHICTSQGNREEAELHFKEALSYFAPLSRHKTYYQSIEHSYASFKNNHPE